MAVWMLAATIAGCANRQPVSHPADGVLVLEVGGDQSSLHAALLAAGIEVAPAPGRHPQRDADGDAPPPEVDEGSNEARGEPVDPVNGGAIGADHVVVELGRGETLMQLAKKHLGASGRYREILERNGWTEADARRLRPGQLVKVPVDRSAASR